MWKTHNTQTSRMFLLSNKQTNKTSEIFIADFWILAHNREFYLDVSELPARHSTTKQRTRCYTDTTSAPELPRNIINIPCNHTGRYVIVETNYILPKEEGAILEMCEIEILGRYSHIKKTHIRRIISSFVLFCGNFIFWIKDNFNFVFSSFE